MTARRVLRSLSTLAAALALPACLLAQSGNPRVVFERTGYRLTALGAKVAVSARLLDARRRAVPNAAVAYRTSDPNIAVVTTKGVVQSKKVGRTKVWAVSGTDSASALIVVDQWASTFSFTPSPVKFDAIGAKAALQVQLRDAAGNTIPDAGRRSAQCRSRDDHVALLAANGQLTAKANGVTFVRCTDRGISDSVRVEVRQRPVRVAIADKLAIGTKNPTDTFRLRARAFDPQGDSIPGARATWVSLSAGVVSIDPVSGFARAVSGGPAKIVTQVGDVTDTVTVTVTGTVSQGTEGGGTNTVTDSTRVRQPTLGLPDLSPLVGSTTEFAVTAVDAAGAAIANPELFIVPQSRDTLLIGILSKPWRIVAKAEGSTFVVVRFADAGMIITDSTLVIARSSAAGASSKTSAAAGVTVAFVRPVFDTAGAKVRNRRQIDSVFRSIRESGIGRTRSGRSLAFEAIAAQTKHSTQQSTFPGEERSGLLVGGRASLAPFRLLVLSGAFKTGTLISATTVGEDLTVAEMDGQLALWPVGWFGLGGGYLLRGERQDVGGLQTFSAVSVSAMTRGTFVGGNVSTFMAVSLFPASTYTGRPADAQPEKTSLAGEAGLDLRIKYVTAGFSYYVESFKFVAVGTSPERADQFSTLRLRFGLKLGR